ncbi:hypothetical protein Goe10_c00570 [Bacillus phage vB_BsuM-Goe10]|nr:hypothetical protein Goe10_c00570 [Bacillus phage vB_BsuM-Goe10]
MPIKQGELYGSPFFFSFVRRKERNDYGMGNCKVQQRGN